MPSKAQLYAQMADHAATQITGSYQEWTAFLTTAARLYKYPYDEQLMIFAQRPDATACAEYDLWNEKMRRYVRRGSRGIALIDTTGGQPRLRYVFDISDTGGGENSRRPFLWQYRPEEHRDTVTAALENHFDVTGENGLPDQLERIAAQLAQEYWDDHQRDILAIVDGSFLEGYDELNVGVQFRNAATVSISYALMSRCGLDPDDYYEHEDFFSVFDFNTSAAVAALGTAVSESNQTVLRQIGIAIQNYERAKSAERSATHGEQPDLHQERGLPHPRPDAGRDAGGQAPGQVREDAPGVSEGASPGTVEHPAPEREAVPAPAGDRRDGQQPSGADDAGAEEVGGRDGGTQGQRPHEVGGPDEHPQGSGGGNPALGADLQLTPQEPEETPAAQLSLFPSEREQIQSIQEGSSVKTPDPSSVSKEDIDAELRRGTGTADGKLRVHAFYQQERDAKEAVAFLKHEYGYYRHSHTFVDGGQGFVEYTSDKGMILRRYEPEQEIKLTWNAIDKRLRELVTARRYLTTEELASLITQADIDALLVQDWNVPGRKQQILKWFQQGLTDEQLEGALRSVYNLSPDIVPPRTGGLVDLADGASGYAYYVAAGVRIENRQNGGWREVGYGEMAQHIRALIDTGQYLTPEEQAALVEQPAPVPEAPAPAAPRQAAPPDPQAAIDNALREWNGDPDSRRRVAAHMETHARDKETAAFLRAEYGDDLPAFPVTGEGMAQDMPWPKVQRRLAQLIQQGAFLPSVDHEAEPPQSHVLEPYVRYKPVVIAAVSEDTAYRNACGHFDREDAGIECNAAVRRAVLNAGDMELIRLFSDMPEFRRRLHQEVFDETYPQLHELLRPLSQEDIDEALRSWNGDMDSKRAVVRYMADRGRDKETAEWLSHEYGGGDNKSLFIIRAGSPEAMELPWPKVQHRLAQLIQQGAFLTGEEQEAPEPERPLGPSPTVREIFEHYLPIVKELVLSDVPYQNACKNSDRQNAYLEGGEAVKRAVSSIGDANFLRLYYDLTGFHNNLHQRVLDETYPMLAQAPGIAQQGRPADAPAQESDAAAYRLLSRLRSDCDYFLGEGQGAEKHLWAGSVKAQIAKMRELYDSLPEKPEWLTVEAIDAYERRMTGLEQAPPAPARDPDAPPYKVGDTVYLDDTAFEITALRDSEVQLLDPSLSYPIFRAESRESFERMLWRDDRNRPVTDFLAASMEGVNDDLRDVLVNGLLTQPDKEAIVNLFRKGAGNSAVASYLALSLAGRTETMELETGDTVDYFTSTFGIEAEIQDKFRSKLSASWRDTAPILRALCREWEHSRYRVEETSDAFEEPFILRDTMTGEYYDIDDVYQTFETEEEVRALAAQLNTGAAPEPPAPLEGIPAYQVGDEVALPYGDRELTGTVGYVGENDVRIDTGPYSWSHESVNREQFEDGLRQDGRNAALFTPEDEAPATENFRITDDALGVGNAREKYRRNVEAIRTLKQIEDAGRTATAAEQETLSRYVGWGGLPDAFDQDKEAWAAEYAELKDLLTPEEYASARASTLNAHYTSPTVARAIYEVVGNLGFHSGNILEPSCGVGNFFGLLPEGMAASKLYGVELDSISGRIAGQLYPKASIAVRGFEKTNFPDGFFDVAIGNVPFGGYKVVDSRYDKHNFFIHDYFLAKAIDKVRPGGVLAFITSNGVSGGLSCPSYRRAREYLAERCDLLGAIRLPNNAFAANAGTDMTTDILFLQKLDAPRQLGAQPPLWVQTDTLLEQDHTNGQGETRHNFVTVNRYFQQHPEMVLGELKIVSGPFGPQLTCQPLPDADLAQQLSQAVGHIHGQITEAELPDLGEGEEIDSSIPADPNVKNYSYTVVDGEVYYRENSRMVRPELNATAKARVKGMVELRDCMRELIDLQMDECPDEAIIRQQAKLEVLYDAFTSRYGLLNDRGNALAFADDSSYYLLCSLEVLDEDGRLERKADMFSKRTIKKHEAVTSVDTASEALAVSIAEKARVDMPYMEQLSGKTEDELAGELKGVIFRLPEPVGEDGSPRYAAADEYLSGNIREKLARARQAAEQAPALFQANVEALEQALPKDLDASEIDVRLGATWVDKRYIQQFMYETFRTPGYVRSKVHVNFSAFTAEWNVSGKNEIPWNDIAAFTTFGTERASAYRILEDSLNLRDVRIYDTITDPDGKERRVLNRDETTLAQQKQQAVKDAFRDWIWKDPDRRQTLVRKYNDLYNSTRPREYDGRHITFGGINPEIQLREHQLNAIAHVLYGDNVLLAHEVGAGKTFEMVAAAMESKRLGLCQKSLFAVPNHLIEQWASEFLRLYPSANILVARKKDFESRNRKKFCAKIATGDYDAVIMGHSQFERLPVSYERRERLLQQQLWEIEEGIEELRASGAERYSIKQLERTKRSLEARLDKLHDGTRKDDVVTFEQLGVDRLFIDEAHNYKNLFLYTKMRNVAGLSTTDAQKSSDMLLKCRYIDEVTDGRGVVFATGTPVSNSMTELYTMQRYLQHDLLGKQALTHFDNWASIFGETVTAIELAPEGTGYRARTRFARFFNLPELMAMFKEAADIKTADQLNLPVPEVEYHTEVAEPTEHQQTLVQELSERAAIVHSGQVDPRVDNMLKITSDGRKLGLDQRLINPMLPDDPRSKLNMCVGNILRIYQEGQADKLAQLVFCDISTPKAKAAANQERAARIAGDKTAGGAELHALGNLLDVEPDPPFSVYEDIRDKLIAGGIPAHQIAFIHDANTDARKKELFAKVRSGQVRVLMGSTFKMGAGMNVQDRLIALHDLDCPWRPGDLEQRKGRIVRQGNHNEKVHIYRYVTNGTFDSYLWQTVENKQKFISQIMTSKSPVRSCEDVDETALSYAEIKALCAGNPLIKEKMDLDIDVSRLRILKASHLSQQYRLEDDILKHFPEQIEANKGYIAGFKADMETLEAHPHPMIPVSQAATPEAGAERPDSADAPVEGGTESPAAPGEAGQPTDAPPENTAVAMQKGFAGIVIRGDTLTDKDNAGAAILAACKEVKGGDPVEIGSYRGFTMSLSVENFGKDFILTMKGKMTHRVTLGKDARGNLNRMDNALASMPERLAAVEERLENIHKQMAAAKAELGKPFPQEAELGEKSARLAALNIQLDMDTGKQGRQASRPSAKQERPSVLESLKRPLPPRGAEKKPKHREQEVR